MKKTKSCVILNIKISDMKEDVIMNDKKALKLVMSAMFASLVCVATMIIKIQTVTNGYINIGDCFVLLSGWLLGGVYGAFAAGIGSFLADILAGYPVYAVATFIIKGVMALIAYWVFHRNKSFSKALVSATLAELFMAVSYLIFDYFVMGYGNAAVVSFPANIVQGIVGAVLGLLLLNLMRNNKTLKDYFKI